MERNAAQSPFFTIVTPNHNSGDGLERCIASLAANDTAYEHIIIDDASSDDSFLRVERSHAARPPTSLVLRRNAENLGPGPTRNHGLSLARGRYVLFCDADDTFVAGALDTLKAQIVAFDCPQVVVFRYCLQGPQGERESTPLCSQPLERTQMQAFTDFMHDRIVSAPWGKAIRADLACALSFPDLPVSQDGLYNLELFGRAARVLYLPQVLYRFDKRSDGSLTRKPFGNRELARFHRSWQVFDSRYREQFAAAHGLALLEIRALRFVGVSFIMRQAINKTHDDDQVRQVVMSQLRQSSWAALRQLSLKEKALLMSYAFSPSLSRQLIRRSQYAS
ncbi:glycosyltransferase family 2 protein [Cobetia marina]|jgi:glycosyltransferase involved in cell wall biosynthesis|uniref:glycosyltransferase family 2 protein n=1 Tax=Cobetia TaxID=204286 RepID=UPI0009868ECC|nr:MULTISPECIES: glycosyltransferase family 2 protein [Cobetia]MDA5565021.1 glycosyltransferase family 2 protein [Cobetia sp. MMG027]MDH2292436.1 glycosyltransferase family 2 protein [Cobetia sp. 10Alg 146]MDH2375338.1 glycosyltransferase family 2 protein [Cobetia sp. 3AK]MDI6002608.1 glycosyltransferase family 2 protein [Cobetia pacifica]MDN2657918.1 glycosyltransferase family 2 protein [Cobetia sp. 14N.309.X.WAT.E.A4]